MSGGVLNTKTRTWHRDPGCARIFVNGKPDEAYEDRDRRPADSRPCFYCHSRAGRRRYP